MNSTQTTSAEEIRIGKNVKLNPLVSVVVPAYNLAPFIAETLDSILAQTFTDFEIILVNDGSPDTKEFERVLQPYFDNIIYVKRPNGGAAAARNSAIRHSNGILLAFLDGDDIWMPDYLESQVRFLQENEYEMVSADALMFGQPFIEGETFSRHTKSSGSVTFENLLSWKRSIITSGTVVLKRKFEELGLFNESEIWRRGQDYEMWLRLLKNKTSAGYLNKVLLRYRVRHNSLSGNNIEQAERNVCGLAAVIETFELSRREQEIWQERMNHSMAFLHLEIAKSHLVKGEFETARKSFSEAVKYESSFKLKIICRLLLIAPKLVQKIFIKFRPSEVYSIQTAAASAKEKTA
jgi:teichuronic acid biosynthesis glycosyltransferase TuaG